MNAFKYFKRAVGAGLTLALTASVFPAGMSGGATAAAAAKQTPVITVDTSAERGETNPLMRSANHRFAYGGFGMYDIENDEVYKDFEQKNKETKWGAIRYPGGTIANLFKWKDTIGPKSERKNVVLGNSYLSDFPSYGVDEHMQFCERIGATVIYMVAEASEEPSDAADLVEYLNAPNDGSNPGGGVDWAAVRAENGHPEPYNIKYFEIGNEMHIDNQRYWMKYPSAYGENKSYIQKYAQGDTVCATAAPLRVYGTWKDNASNGEANQAFYTQYYPVEKGSQTVYVNGEAWTQVESFKTAGKNDKVYVFDEAKGECVFGDGTNGMIPQNGAVLTVDYNHVHAGFAEYYNAMKAIDPTIKVVSCFENIFSANIGITAEQCDGIAYHDYINFPDNTNTQEKLYDNYMTIADDLAAKMGDNSTHVLSTSGSGDTIALVTEFGTIGIPDVPPSNSAVEMDEARVLARGLAFASTYIGAVDSGVKTAAHQGYTAFSFGNGPALPNAGQVYNSLYASDPNDESQTIESSMALSFKMMGNFTADTKLSSAVANNPTVTQTKSYSALKVLATKDSDSGDIYLLAVNRDPKQDITTSVNLAGYTISADAEITTMNAASYMNCNTPKHPNDVELYSHTQSLGAGGSSFAYTFPAHSIVGIKLSGSSGEHWSSLFDAQDFESRDTGETPDTISLVSGTATVQISESPDGEGNVLEIARKGSNSVLRMALDGASMNQPSHTGISDLARVRLRVRAGQTNSRFNIAVLSSAGEKAANISLDSTGYIKNNTKEQLKYNSNVWYDMEIYLDNNAKKYYLFVNGEQVPNARTDYNNTLSGLPTYLSFELETASGAFYIDDYSVEVSSPAVNEAITGTQTVGITTPIGVSPDLPDSVNLLYNTGKTETAAVTWEKFDEGAYKTPGCFTVKGTAEGYSVSAIIRVLRIEKINDAQTTTLVGIAPELPETVKVTYLDGSLSEQAVKWEEVEPEKYAVKNTFYVSGTVAYTDIKARVKVTVKAEDVQQPDVTDPDDNTGNQNNTSGGNTGTTAAAPTNGTASVNGRTVLYKDGKAVTGTKVVTVSGKTYAVVGGYVVTGKMQVVTISGKSYIVNKSGVIQKGTKNKLIKVGSKSYAVNKSGVIIKSSKNKLVKVGSKSYIVNNKGAVVKGKKNKLVKVGKKAYIVNKKGVVQKNKKSVKVGKKTYSTNKKGVAKLKKAKAKSR